MRSYLLHPVLHSVELNLPNRLLLGNAYDNHMHIFHPRFADLAEAGSGAAFGVMRSLLDAGNTWVKLSGAYTRTRMGEPSYSDVEAPGSALVRAAPERLSWGSDWPHFTQPKDTVNDLRLVDLLQTWCGADAVMDRILMDNPARRYGFA